jgi:peptidoglycan hydrolase-like protein with peptidoglycan-binding domain
MRLASASVFVSLLLIPLVSSAQTAAELQAQIQTLLSQIKILQDKLAATPAQTPVSTTPVSAGANCPSLTRLLSVGSRGTDVTALQEYLRAKGHMTEASTGYFGTLTEAAVKKLQAANNIVASGDAASTGYGAVGPKTRATIASLCSSSATPSVAAPVEQCAQATSPTAPTLACGGRWEKLQNLGCHVGWRCVLPYSGANKPPVVNAIQGPMALGIDAFGTWQISAIDPEGSALSYSYLWGDEGVADMLSALAGLGGTFTSSASASHSYGKAGTYTLQVTAKDTGGATAVGTLGIKVGTESAASSVTPFDEATSVPTASACITPWAAQVVQPGGSVYWQPFFTDGLYFATTSPLMKCDNGGWKKCDAAGNSCQVYTHPTSTPSTAALPSFGNTIGQSCSPEGSTKQAQVPPGTQLCQWLNCRTTTQVETITLKCTHSGWTDYAAY